MLSITVAKLALVFFLFVVLPIVMMRYMVLKTIEAKNKHVHRE